LFSFGPIDIVVANYFYIHSFFLRKKIPFRILEEQQAKKSTVVQNYPIINPIPLFSSCPVIGDFIDGSHIFFLNQKRYHLLLFG
jgi:hypothetical protein